MEPSNLHNHDQLHLHSSPLATPSFYGVATTNSWTPNTILSNNTSNFNPHINSRDSKQENDNLIPSLNTCMIQDMGFHWATSARSFTGIKSEFSNSYQSFAEMTNSPTACMEDMHLYPTSYTKNDVAGEFYSNPQICTTSSAAGTVINVTPSRGTFSQIFPSVNISKMNGSSCDGISNSLDMNLEALDLFNSARFSGSFSQPSTDQLHLFKESLSYSVEHMQQLSQRPPKSPSKIAPFTARIIEAKRSSDFLEPNKAPPQTAPKKSRLDSRASCPPFKVRKEKLGDRIASLQQLVAPFGKTDTASVLMEAIGYIKFLQHQVETLSVPYMKSSRNKTSRTMQGGSIEDENTESNQDLRSRGLCLVPVSCLSYVTDGGGGVWPSPTFTG